MGDAWLNPNRVLNEWWLAYSSAVTGTVRAKGKQVGSPDYIVTQYAEGCFGGTATSADEANIISVGYYGAFGAIGTDTTPRTSVAYEGKCYAMPIALVHRRNQGGYHPVYNSNGTLMANDTTVDARRYWHHSNAFKPTSISDCFLTGVGSSLIGFHSHSGTIASTYKGRHDGLFYDQIHEGDIIDLRNSSQKVEDYNRLLSREFNKAVAGTVRGTEGEIVTTVLGTYSLPDGSTFRVMYPILPNLNIGDIVYVYTYENSAKYRCRVSLINGYAIDLKNDFGSITSTTNRTILVQYTSTHTKSNTLTHTDIIGSPANYPTAWKQSGVSGTPLIVAEDGTSLLPTGSLAVFKLSKKANATPLQVLRSTDSGATWTALSVTTHYTFSTITNAITMVTAPATTDLVMVTYQTKTNMAVPAVNSEVLSIGDVWASNHVTFPQIVTSLLSKIPTGATSPVTSQGYSAYGYRIDATTLKFSTSPIEFPNTSIMTLAGVVGVPTVKAFPYLTRSNGKAYLQLVFKEMKYGSYTAPTTVTAASTTYTFGNEYKINIAGCSLDGEIIQWIGTTTTVAVDWSLYDMNVDGSLYAISSGTVYTNAKMFDGNSWGDDNKFNIVDNVSTTTDDNGATVLIGQKHIELPYFISAGE
jgi:hypothetical protein